MFHGNLIFDQSRFFKKSAKRGLVSGRWIRIQRCSVKSPEHQKIPVLSRQSQNVLGFILGKFQPQNIKRVPMMLFSVHLTQTKSILAINLASYKNLEFVLKPEKSYATSRFEYISINAIIRLRTLFHAVRKQPTPPQRPATKFIFR